MTKAISDYKRPLDRFFAYARERHSIYLRRAAGLPRQDWTSDPILMEHRFTNVFRELDKTTAWFREKVRDPLRDRPEVLLATVLFRMLNRIEVGEAVFTQPDLIYGKGSAFEHYLQYGQIEVLRDAIRAFVGKKGPFVTGAYIISTPPGHKKLDGVLWIVDEFRENSDWEAWAHDSLQSRKFTLKDTFDALRESPYLGTFHSYEIVTDLRHTALLDRAPDVLTWANMGPGAQRGLNRIADRSRKGDASNKRWNVRVPTEQALEEMREILRASRDARYWPQFRNSGKHDQHLETSNRIYMHDRSLGHEKWPAWELREVEHTLCEFDKFERVRTGEGRPRGKFR